MNEKNLHWNQQTQFWLELETELESCVKQTKEERSDGLRNLKRRAQPRPESGDRRLAESTAKFTAGSFKMSLVWDAEETWPING